MTKAYLPHDPFRGKGEGYTQTGEERTWRRQQFRCVRGRDNRKLATWESHCADCGAPYRFRTFRGEVPYPTTRCGECKAARKEKAQERAAERAEKDKAKRTVRRVCRSCRGWFTHVRRHDPEDRRVKGAVPTRCGACRGEGVFG